MFFFIFSLVIFSDNEQLSLAFKGEEEQRVILEKNNIKLIEKYDKTMEELKETYNFLISINGEFQEVENEAKDLKDAKEVHTHIFKIIEKVQN